MKRLSATLSNLIVLAEEFLTRPQTVDREMVGERLAEIAAEVRQADARPAENIRTTNAALVMITALEQCRFSGEAEGMPWLMIACAAMPLLRKETFVTFRNEREQR